MGIWYCTRESVKGALDSKLTARNDAQVDDAIEAASREVEGLLHRVFYPWTGTRHFDWPTEGGGGRPWRLWLDADELVSVTSITAGGVPVTSYFLEPANSGPPYTHVEVDLSSSSAFAAGATHQRAIAIAGVWAGCRIVEAPDATLAEALDASETAVDVTATATIGVGSVLRVDSERMVVTGRNWLDSGQNLGGSGLSAQANDVTVPVTTGSAYTAGEVLLIDAERMLVVDVAGNNLAVKRAWDGSVLATHANGADVYASRTLTVERGALGTTAATHDTAAAVVRWVPPALVGSLARAEAINTFQQEASAYGRTVGSGDNEREARGAGLKDIRDQAYTRHGRKARIRAI